MPNNVDFSKLEDIKTIEVNPEHWISPLYVEYGVSEEVSQYATICYFWRVKGTEHTFIIPVTRLDYISSGDYKKHFENALEIFRDDYLIWASENFIYDWSKEYKDQFSKFIII